jgi:hypothetical protein
MAESKDIPQMTYEELRSEHDRVHRVIQGVSSGEPVAIPRDAHAYYGLREDLKSEMQERFPERYVQDQSRIQSDIAVGIRNPTQTLDDDARNGATTQARAILEYDARTPAERESLDARLQARSSDLVRDGVVAVGTSAVVVAALEIRAAERAIESIGSTLQAARTGIVEGMNGIEALPSSQHGAARNYYAGKAAGFEEVRSSLESSLPSAGIPARIDVGSEMKTGVTAGQERSAGRSVSASFA